MSLNVYTHIDKDDKAEAVAKLPSYLPTLQMSAAAESSGQSRNQNGDSMAEMVPSVVPSGAQRCPTLRFRSTVGDVFATRLSAWSCDIKLFCRKRLDAV